MKSEVTRQHKNHSGMAMVEVAIVVLIVFGLLLTGLYFANTLRTNACITDASDELLQKVANDPAIYKVFNANVYPWSYPSWQGALSTLETYFKRSDGKLALCGLSNKRFMQVKYFSITSDGTETEVPGTYSFAMVLPGQKIQVEQVDSSGATSGWIDVYHPEKNPEQGRGVELPQLLTLYPVRGSAFLYSSSIFNNGLGNFSSKTYKNDFEKSARNIARVMNVGSVTPTPFGWTPPPPTNTPGSSPTPTIAPSPTLPGQPTNTPPPGTPTPDATQTSNAQQSATAQATQSANPSLTAAAKTATAAAPTSSPAPTSAASPTSPSGTPTVGPSPTTAQQQCCNCFTPYPTQPGGGTGYPPQCPPELPFQICSGFAAMGGQRNCFCAARRGLGCFDPETIILMADNTSKTAFEIRIGDLVMNPLTHKPARVTQVVAGEELKPMVDIVMNGDRIRVTEWHPFLTADGIKPAKDITSDDKIMDAITGQFEPIQSITRPKIIPGQNVIFFDLGDSTDVKDRMMVAGKRFVVADRREQEEIVKRQNPSLAAESSASKGGK